MSGSADKPVTREWLLAHAMAIETEAVDRYEELADQMEVHNNPEVAAFFLRRAPRRGRRRTRAARSRRPLGPGLGGRRKPGITQAHR